MNVLTYIRAMRVQLETAWLASPDAAVPIQWPNGAKITAIPRLRWQYTTDEIRSSGSSCDEIDGTITISVIGEVNEGEDDAVSMAERVAALLPKQLLAGNGTVSYENKLINEGSELDNERAYGVDITVDYIASMPR